MSKYTPPERAGRREWFGLVVLLLPLMLVSMDMSVLYFAVPFIASDMLLTSTQQLWIFDIYGFVLAGMLITMGAIGDRVGRRRLLMVGATAFGAASVLAAYSNGFSELVGARALLGLGGAILAPSTLSLLRNIFRDEKQRVVAIGIWSGALAGGVALGPVISGVLLEHFWWGSVFLINVPFMLLLLVLAPVVLPEFKNPNPDRFDLLSAVLSLVAMLSFVYGIKQAAIHGIDRTPVLCIVAGLVVGALFVRRQITHPGSLIDIALFRHHAFSASIATNFIAMVAISGFAIYSTQYLQLVRGMRPLEAALWSLLPSVATGGMAPAAAAIARSVPRAYVMGAGFLIAAVGFAILSRTSVETALWVVLAGAACYAGGLVAVISLVTGIILDIAPPERAGSASGTLESANQLGGALGVAVLGSIGAAIYRNDVVEQLPAGLPSAVADTARDSLAGAVGVAAQVPSMATTILDSARTAFMNGFDVVALTVLGVMVFGAVVSLVFLRSAGTVSSKKPAPAEVEQVEVTPVAVPEPVTVR